MIANKREKRRKERGETDREKRHTLTQRKKGEI